MSNISPPFNNTHYPLLVTPNPLIEGEYGVVGTDKKMMLFSLQTQTLMSLEGGSHYKKIQALKFSGHKESEELSNLLISGAEDGVINLWDRRSAQRLHSIVSSGGPVLSLAIASNIFATGT